MKKICIFLFMFFPLFLDAQGIHAYRSVSEGKVPELRWGTLADLKADTFYVYRAPVGSSQYMQIRTFQHAYKSGDTLFFRVNDTTLTTKGLYQYYIDAKDSRDSVVHSEVMYAHNLGSLPSPHVTSFTATSATDSKNLILKWKLNYSFTVKALVLFRSTDREKGFEPIATLSPATESYTDHVAVSNEAYYYFLQISDYFGYQLPSVVIHGICTYAEKGYPPQHFTARVNGKTVELSMQKLGTNIAGFRIYRQDKPSRHFVPVSRMIPATGTTAYFTDTAVNSEGMIRVRYYAVTLSDGDMESNPTDTLDVMLPWNSVVPAPEEVNYSTDSAGMIRLFWSLKNLTPEVKGFNIYRTGEDGIPVRINPSLVTYPKNSFTDKTLKAFGSFTYSVESVSMGDNPSIARTSIVALHNPPVMHIVLMSSQKGTTVEMKWIDPKKPGLDALYFYRKTGESEATLAGMVKPSAGKWTDTGVQKGNSYIYTLVAEFKDGSRFLINDGVLVRVE